MFNLEKVSNCIYVFMSLVIKYRVLKEESVNTGVIIDVDDEFTATAGGGDGGGRMGGVDTTQPSTKNNQQTDSVGSSFSKKVYFSFLEFLYQSYVLYFEKQTRI